MGRGDQNRESEMEEEDMEEYGRVKARSIEQGLIAMGQGSLWIRYLNGVKLAAVNCSHQE